MIRVTVRNVLCSRETLSVLLILSAFIGSVRAADRPNILFMMSDDQAWNGLSVPMHPDLDWSKSSIVGTPNLEKLAAQGMRFTAAYAPASVCAPTRISLQTGKSPAAVHWTKASRSVTAVDGYKMIGPRNVRQIDRNETTIGELLRDAGYRTAHFGKWHINGGGPAAHGYDESDGDTGNEYAFQYRDPNPADVFGMAKRAAAFMEQSKKANKPFFIQMSWHALHAPQNAMKTTLAKYAKRMNSSVDEKRVGSAAIAENLDTGVGMVIDAIDRLDLADNTFVIYMSDNGSGGGGRRRGGGLSGGKGSVWEGGIRSPFIIRGPGIPENSWCHERIVGYDLFPTYCQWAGIVLSNLPPDIEGGSIVNLLDDGKGLVKRPREEMVFHFPHYQSGDGPHSALFLGNYKLMKFYEDNRLALFDIAADISEQNDLSTQQPQKVKELDKLLEQYLQNVDAQMAVSNPQYDPAKQPVSRKAKGGRGKTKKTRKPGTNKRANQ